MRPHKRDSHTDITLTKEKGCEKSGDNELKAVKRTAFRRRTSLL